MHESIDKLLKIKKSHSYNKNPFSYSEDFNDNSSKCFRCVHHVSLAGLNSSYDELLNRTIYTEKQVFLVIMIILDFYFKNK